MKIRIGNDIRLNVTLPTDVDYQLTDIKRIRAFLINTTADTYTVGLPKRFPDQPFPDYYVPDAYNTGECDIPCYFTEPFEHTNPYMFDPSFNNPYIYFGANPCGPGFPSGIDPWYRHGFGYHPRHLFMTPNLNYSKKNVFMAPSTVDSDNNVIQVYFPANKLFEVGMYKLVLVVDVYDFGWNNANLRTYTYDFDDVFELSDDSNASTGSATIDVNRDGYLKTINLTAVSPSIYSSDSTLISAKMNYSNASEKVMKVTDVSKMELTVYNEDGSVSANQSAFIVQPDKTIGYIAEVVNKNAIEGSYCLLTVYANDKVFDTIKITSKGYKDNTNISSLLMYYILNGVKTIISTDTILEIAITNTNMIIGYNVIGVGDVVLTDSEKTAKWADEDSTENPRIIDTTTVSTRSFFATSIADQNKKTPIFTLTVTDLPVVKKAQLLYSIDGGITYIEASEDTTINIIAGNTVIFGYKISGLNSYDKTAIWSDNKLTENPRTIKYIDNYETNYSYYAISVGNSDIKTKTLTIHVTPTDLINITGILLEYGIDNNTISIMPEDTTINVYYPLSISTRGTLLGTNILDNNIKEVDGETWLSSPISNLFFASRAVLDYPVLYTSKGNPSLKSKTLTINNYGLLSNIADITMYYTKNGETIQVTSDTTVNCIPSDQVTVNYVITLKDKSLPITDKSKIIAEWFLNGAGTGNTNTSYTVTLN